MGWDEDGLHRWLARTATTGGLAGSPMHDAAVFPWREPRAVACVDQTIEGVHAPLGVAGRVLGRKAAARALSDLAATAARPRAVLCALAADPSEGAARLRRVLEGVRAEARRAGAELAGGDLSARPGPLALAVTALGERPAKRPPGRDRARPGDRLLLTGPVGGAGLGRNLRIRPRLAEGLWLVEAGARAMMDISDGLAWDLYRLARASGVRVVLERVPLHRDARRAARADGRTPLDHALHDGEDHELVATLAPAAARRALALAPRRCRGLVEIGRIERGSGLWLASELTGGRGRRWRREEGGWCHGR